MSGFLSALRKYGDFNGRSRRREYWGFIITEWIIMSILAMIFIITVADKFEETDFGYSLAVDDLTGVGMALFVILLVAGLFFLIPMYSVSVRRLHDTGRSGWWVLFLLFLPIVVWILALFDGDRGTNMYGPDPKARELAG